VTPMGKHPWGINCPGLPFTTSFTDSSHSIIDLGHHPSRNRRLAGLCRQAVKAPASRAVAKRVSKRRRAGLAVCGSPVTVTMSRSRTDRRTQSIRSRRPSEEHRSSNRIFCLPEPDRTSPNTTTPPTVPSIGRPFIPRAN